MITAAPTAPGEKWGISRSFSPKRWDDEAPGAGGA
jgi:hypothetical protein